LINITRKIKIKVNYIIVNYLTKLVSIRKANKLKKILLEIRKWDNPDILLNLGHGYYYYTLF